MRLRLSVRRIAQAAAVTLALIVALVAVMVTWLSQTDAGRSVVRDVGLSRLNDTLLTGRLEVGALRGNLFREVEFNDVSLYDAEGRVAAHMTSLRAEYDLWALRRGQISVREISVVGPKVRVDAFAAPETLIRASETDPRAPASGEPARPWTVDIARVSISDGSVTYGVAAEPEGFVLDGLTLGAAVSIGAAGEVDVRVDGVSATLDVPAASVVDAGVALDGLAVRIAGDTATLRLASLGALGVAVEAVEGAVRLSQGVGPFERVDLSVGALRAPRQAVAALAPGAPLVADLEARVDLSGGPDALSLRVPVRGGVGEISIESDLDLVARRAVARVVALRVRPETWVAGAPTGDVTVAARVQAEAPPGADPVAAWSIDLGPSRLDAARIAGGWVDGRWYDARVVLDSVRLWDAEGDLAAHGHYETDGQFRVAAAARVVDLGAAAASAGRPETLSGSGAVAVDLEGALPSFASAEASVDDWLSWLPSLSGTVAASAHDVVVGGASVGRADLRVGGAANSGALDVSVHVRDAEASGVRVGSVSLDARVSRDHAVWEARVAGAGGADGAIRAATRWSRDEVESTIEALALTVQAKTVALADPTRLGVALADFEPRAIWLDPARFASSGVTVVVGGTFDVAARAVDASADVTAPDVAVTLQALGLETPVREGAATLSATFAGPLERPTARVSAALQGLVVGLATPSEGSGDDGPEWRSSAIGGDLELQYAEGALTGALAARGAEAAVEVALGGPGLPLRLDLAEGVMEIEREREMSIAVALRDVDVGAGGPWMPAGQEASGRITLVGRAAGTPSAPALSASVATSELRLATVVEGEGARVRAELPAHLEAELSYDDTTGLGVEVAAGLDSGLSVVATGHGALDVEELVRDFAGVLARSRFSVDARLETDVARDLPDTLRAAVGLEGGSLDAHVVWRGTTSGGEGAATLALREVVVGEAPPVSFQGRVKAGAFVQIGGRLEVGSATETPIAAMLDLMFETSAARMLDGLDAMTRLRGRLQMPATPVSAFAFLEPSLEEETGTLGGFVDVSGTFWTPSVLGRVALREFDVAGAEPGTLGVEVAFDGSTASATLLGCDGGMRAADAVVRVRVPWWTILATGDAAPASWPIDGHVRVVDAPVGSLLPTLVAERWVSDPEGRLDAAVAVSGTVGAPAIDGHLALREGAGEVVALGRRLEGVVVDAEISSSVLALRQFQARDDRGSLRATAAVTLADYVPTSLELEAAVEDFMVSDASGAGVLVTGRLDLDGRLSDTGRVDLDVRLADLSLDVPDDTGVEAGPTELPHWVHVVGRDVAPSEIGARSPALLTDAPPDARSGGETTFAATVRTSNTASLHQQYADIDIDVDLRVLATPDAVSMDGRVSLPRGSVRVAGKSFALQPGSVLFSPDDGGVDPRIDVVAVHELPADVTAHLSQTVGPPSGDAATVRVAVRGRLSELARAPEDALVLSSDPPLSESDIFQVLASGGLSGEASAEDGQQGVAALSSLLLGFVGDQITGGIPIDTLRIESSSETQRVEGGKYIADNLYVSGTYIRSPEDRSDNNFEVSLDWILRQIGPGSLRLEFRGGDRARGGIELLYHIVRAASRRAR